MDIAINTVSYTNYYDLENSIDVISDLGVRYVEIYGEWPHAWPDDLDRAARIRLRKKVQDYGLEILTLGVGLGFAASPGIASSNQLIRNNHQLHMEKLADLAYDIEAKYLNILSGKILPHMSYQEGYNNSVNELKKLSKYVEKLNVAILLENTIDKMYITNTPTSLTKLIQDIDYEEIYIRFDPQHANVTKIDLEILFDFFKRNFEKIAMIGIHDNMGDMDSHLPLGQGNVNHDKIFKEIKKLNYEGVLAIEIEPNPTWSIDEVKKHVRETKEKVETLIKRLR